MTDDGRFLSRWSQRKRLAAEEARKAAELAPASEPAPAPDDAEAPFDLSCLPDIDALTAQTDMSLFLQKGVPDELRNAALRKIWALDPAIRDYVGDALDYAWDWNAPGGVPGGGELGAGFDTARMVAQIFGDPVFDKNVIEDDAVQQNAPQSLAASPVLPENAAPAEDRVAENAAASCTSVQVEPEPSERASAVAPQKKRRHGGAAPMPPSKSSVS